MAKQNPMQQVKIDKVTINVGVGEGGAKLENAINVLKKIVGRTPVKTTTQKRIPDFGVRPKTVIGCKLTIRGAEAEKFLRRALSAIENNVKERSFDALGNFSFGIKEHIDLPDVKYDPNLGIIGMDVCVTLKRPGYRVKWRRMRAAPIGKHHLVSKADAIGFAEKVLGAKILREGEGKEEGER
jgi:large subunit ribosomal protein L5